jgi:hypothetical protein
MPWWTDQIVGGFIDARYDFGIALGIGSLNNNDTVQPVEFADISTDILEESLRVVARETVGASLLIGGDEVQVIDRRHGPAQLGHIGCYLVLEIIIQDVGASHCLVHGQTGNVPAANGEVIGMHHGEDIGDRNVNFLARTGLGADANVDARRSEPM